MWGTLWQGFFEKLPENFELTATRVPRVRTWKGRDSFRGWDWVCPGLRASAITAENTENTEGVMDVERPRAIGGTEHDSLSGPPVSSVVSRRRPFRGRGCGRICKYLYGPLPPWTLAKASEAIAVRLDMPAGSGLVGGWEPGFAQPAPGMGQRTFACKQCWGVRNITLTNNSGWNDFVTHISGGLLYGHEVERPGPAFPELSAAGTMRKRRFSHRRRRAAAKTSDFTQIAAQAQVEPARA
jgi:hypothetical protein